MVQLFTVNAEMVSREKACKGIYCLFKESKIEDFYDEGALEAKWRRQIISLHIILAGRRKIVEHS